MDATELYRRTTAEWISRVRGVGADQWNTPTPCPDWDVRALVNHVVGEQRWLPPLMAGATLAEVGGRFDGDLLGADPLAAAEPAASEADAAVPAAIAEERIVQLSFGESSAAEYARSEDVV